MRATQPGFRQREESPASGASQDFSCLAREVLRLRLSMLAINELIKTQTFCVPIHLALGHEAIAVAVSAAMQPGDRLLLTHRNIHYNLARNPSLRAEIDEYLLRDSGLAGGRDGAMNLTNPAAGVIYTSSILANCLPVAAGVAFGQGVNRGGGATFATTGDGALEEGAFYETLMIANSLELPLVIVIENNEWSMHTRIEERRCAIDLGAIATSFGMELHRLGGNDVEAYAATLIGVRDRAAAARKPVIVEVALATLGDYVVADASSPTGRQINYHHGAAPHVSIDNGPVIEASERDPVHAISQRLLPHELSRLCEELRSELEVVLS
jgi:TPP-dependent pyruvate/acetoin dehydrogenase alpha subunit